MAKGSKARRNAAKKNGRPAVQRCPEQGAPNEQKTTTSQTSEQGSDTDPAVTVESTGDKTESVQPGAEEQTVNVVRSNRSEKKARKQLAKLNLKRVWGVSRVCFRKSKNTLLVVKNPEVYRSPAGSYIVFGEARIEQIGQNSPLTTADKSKIESYCRDATSSSCSCSDSDDEEEDSEGLEQKDIELVMSQANVSRAKAIRALRDENSDLVNAIMALTT